MADSNNEAYPSDATLNALTEDLHTGLEYISTGQAPYYLHFRKLVSRLLLATAPASDLRAYDEGSLDIGVKSGYFFDGENLRTYAGSTGNTLADDKAAIYVYLSQSGGLVITEYISFPDWNVPHVRLAQIVTSGGDITSITDCRGQNIFTPPGASAKSACDAIVCIDNEVVCYENSPVMI